MSPRKLGAIEKENYGIVTLANMKVVVNQLKVDKKDYIDLDLTTGQIIAKNNAVRADNCYSVPMAL